MKRQPYFQVGEEVTAIFKNYPESNGDYVILEVLSNQQARQEILGTGSKLLCEFYYRLDGLELIWQGQVAGDFAGEPALRKKYPPSSQSFNELISSIKQNEHA